MICTSSAATLNEPIDDTLIIDFKICSVIANPGNCMTAPQIKFSSVIPMRGAGFELSFYW